MNWVRSAANVVGVDRALGRPHPRAADLVLAQELQSDRERHAGVPAHPSLGERARVDADGELLAVARAVRERPHDEQRVARALGRRAGRVRELGGALLERELARVVLGGDRPQVLEDPVRAGHDVDRPAQAVEVPRERHGLGVADAVGPERADPGVVDVDRLQRPRLAPLAAVHGLDRAAALEQPVLDGGAAVARHGVVGLLLRDRAGQLPAGDDLVDVVEPPGRDQRAHVAPARAAAHADDHARAVLAGELVELERLERRLPVIVDVEVVAAGFDRRAQDRGRELRERPHRVQDHVAPGEQLLERRRCPSHRPTPPRTGRRPPPRAARHTPCCDPR